MEGAAVSSARRGGRGRAGLGRAAAGGTRRPRTVPGAAAGGSARWARRPARVRPLGREGGSSGLLAVSVRARRGSGRGAGGWSNRLQNGRWGGARACCCRGPGRPAPPARLAAAGGRPGEPPSGLPPAPSRRPWTLSGTVLPPRERELASGRAVRWLLAGGREPEPGALGSAGFPAALNSAPTLTDEVEAFVEDWKNTFCRVLKSHRSEASAAGLALFMVQRIIDGEKESKYI